MGYFGGREELRECESEGSVHMEKKRIGRRLESRSFDEGRASESPRRRGRVELTIGMSSSLASRNSIPSGGTTLDIPPFPFSASDRLLPPRIDGSNQILYLSGLFSPSLGIPVTLSIAFDHKSDIEPILMTVRTKTRTDRMSDQETKNRKKSEKNQAYLPSLLDDSTRFPVSPSRPVPLLSL